MSKAELIRNPLAKHAGFLSFCFFLFLNVSCGLDSFYVLDAPQTDGHNVYASTDNYIDRYFSFMTTETGSNYQYIKTASNNPDFIFIGTEVYYRIYNNKTDMESAESSITTLNTTSNYTAAAEKLISLGYLPLKFSSNYSISPLVKTIGANQYVYIRLTDFQSIEDYKACVCIGDAKMTVYTQACSVMKEGVPVYPRRAISESSQEYSFNFGGSNKNIDLVPASGDKDVKYNSTFTADKTWYVDMYAVSVGRDTTYTTSYSLVYWMGSVTIVEESDQN